MKKTTSFLAVLAAISLAFALAWMNRYQYFRIVGAEGISERVLRINRFTGQIRYSQEDGTWNSNLIPPKPVVQSSSALPPPRPLLPLADGSQLPPPRPLTSAQPQK